MARSRNQSPVEKSIGTACHISFLSLHPLLISLSRTFTSPAGSPATVDAPLMRAGSRLLTACFYHCLSDFDPIRTPQAEKAGVRRPSFPLSFRLRPYNKPARHAIVDQRSASPSDNPPRPCQSRPLILNLVSTSLSACRPHPCSNPS